MKNNPVLNIETTRSTERIIFMKEIENAAKTTSPFT
jgi:hypothetical protein